MSVSPHTQVAKGEQVITSLKVGDQVVAYDLATTSPQTVQDVWINHDTDLLDLHLQTRVQVDPSVTRRLSIYG